MVVWKAFPGGTFTVGEGQDCWIELKRWAEDDCEIFGGGGPHEIKFGSRRLKSTPDIIQSLRVLKNNEQIHLVDWSTHPDQENWPTNVWAADFDVLRVEYSTDEPETRVWGYFNDVNTHIAIQGVRVTIGPYFVYSDVNGFYSLSGLFGNEFDVEASHPNYQTLYVHPVNITNYEYNWNRLMTPSTGPPIEPGITIIGQVLDKDGDVPILDALVKWGAAQTTTDSSGQYTLTDVVPGVGWLTAYAAERKAQSKPLTTPPIGTFTEDFLLEKEIGPPVPAPVIEEPKLPEEWNIDARNIIDTFKPIASIFPAVWSADFLTGIYRTFWHKDPITQADIVPDARDYATVAMVILGSGVAGYAIISSLAAKAGAATVAGELVNAGILSEATELGVPAAGGIASLIGKAAVTTPAAAGPLLVKMVGGGGLGGFWKIFIPIMAIQQLDYIGWGLGYSPEPIHRKLDKICTTINGSFIRLDRLIKAGDFEAAYGIVDSIEGQIAFLKVELGKLGTDFWTHFGANYSDIQLIVDSFSKELEAIIRAYPVLRAVPVAYPETITGVVNKITDGDTIWIDDMYEVRLVGIDCHESGTTAGLFEWNFLQELIFNQTVTVKVDPLNKADVYGRALGTVFKDGENINHKMLAQFGEYILPDVKYHFRNKYVDWDENKIIAKTREIPVTPPIAEPYAEEVGELNITSSPTYAKIFLNGDDTGLRTAETLKNIPVGDYSITLQAPGYDSDTTTATVESGKTTEVNVKLVKQPVPAGLRKPSRTALETHFKDAIITENDARSGLADLGYTTEEVDNFLSEWILELKQHQIMEIYLGNVASKERVTFYLSYQGYTDADIDGLFIRWDEESQRRVEQATLGNIGVTSEPKYSDVYIDGDNWAGVTPMLIRSVEPGTHTVKCTYYGYQDKEIQVTVMAGKEVSAHLVLEETAS